MFNERIPYTYAYRKHYHRQNRESYLHSQLHPNPFEILIQKGLHLTTCTSKDVKQGSKVVNDYTKIQFNYHVFCGLKAAFVAPMNAEYPNNQFQYLDCNLFTIRIRIQAPSGVTFNIKVYFMRNFVRTSWESYLTQTSILAYTISLSSFGSFTTISKQTWLSAFTPTLVWCLYLSLGCVSPCRYIMVNNALLWVNFYDSELGIRHGWLMSFNFFKFYMVSYKFNGWFF